jgi:hypothetical protein
MITDISKYSEIWAEQTVGTVFVRVLENSAIQRVGKIQSVPMLEQLVSIVANFFSADGSDWVSVSGTQLNVAALVSDT